MCSGGWTVSDGWSEMSDVYIQSVDAWRNKGSWGSPIEGKMSDLSLIYPEWRRCVEIVRDLMNV